MKRIEEITDDLIGKKITCTLGTSREYTITDGRIQKQDSHFYICQNEAAGFDCPDKLGYKCSWDTGNGSRKDLKDYTVFDLILLDEVVTEYEIY